MIGRGSETEESMQARLGEAEKEISRADDYDYRVVNEDLEVAIECVREIIDQEREREE